MNKMSEDEIIERVNKFINITVLYGKTYGMTCDDLKKYQQVFRGLLDLYQQEKGNRRMAERNYDELTKTTGRLETELEEEKKKVRATIIGRIDQVSLDDLIGDKYISKEKIKTLKENFNKKQSSFMYRSK